ncbi:MAG: ABC-type transport system substrate-binding protein, partial [Glaciecola sp.]
YASTGFTGLYSDADMDALIAAEQQATDLSARLSIFDDIQKKAAADMPLIPLYEEVPFAYYGPGISGVETTLDAVQQTRYWVISKS